MKKILSIVILASFALSCNDISQIDNQGHGLIKVSIPGKIVTKGGTVADEENESVLKDVQILIFNSSGDLYRYEDIGSSDSKTFNNVKAGEYKVYAVANGPALSSITTETGLNQVQVELGDYNDLSEGFVMGSYVSVTVENDKTATAEIALDRYVARVSISKIVNDLPYSYGSLVVTCAWLSNVVGKVSLSGEASGNVWYNKEGRADETSRVSSHIIDGTTYKASCPSLTFKSYNTTISYGMEDTGVNYFYGYPNSSTQDPDGFHSTFEAQRTVLVVGAKVNGTLYWYPVALSSGLERNKAYDVQLTITGEGSDDPNILVKKGAIEAKVTVSDWTTGESYVETI